MCGLPNGLLARVAYAHEGDPSAAARLATQAEAFRHLAPAGRTPRLHDVIEPRPGLPGGALDRRLASTAARRICPTSSAPMADTLARIHALPLPAAGSPIPRQKNPFLETLAAVEQNAMRFLDKAVPDPDARAEIAEELRLLRGMAPAMAQRAQPLTVALADTHPGNFIVDRDGIAWFVDLEKVHVGSPAIDLAHATLATSTLWHPDVGKVLSRDEVQRFYTLYLEKVGDRQAASPRTVAAADAPADLASDHAFHGSVARADAQPARSVGSHTMERRRSRAGDEGAHRSAHRSMFSPRHDSVDSSRMDGLTRSLFVLRVGPS